MKFTNRLGLPESYVEAVRRASEYKPGGDISVTGLISAPRVHQLRKRHEDELTEDVADWSVSTRFEGTAVHDALAACAQPGDIVKERFSVERNGWKITGEPDLLEANGTLTDWKRTSVWSVILGSKKEWLDQVNLYDLLLREGGKTVKQAQIVALFRDWQASAARRDPMGYPQENRLKVPIHLHTPEVQERLLESRLKIHQEAAGLPDDALPECTPEEKWQRETTWAVMKEGRRSSLANFTIPKHGENAESMAEDRAREVGGVVQYRPGEAMMCSTWCSVRHICPAGRAAMQAKGGGEE